MTSVTTVSPALKGSVMLKTTKPHQSCPDVEIYRDDVAAWLASCTHEFSNVPCAENDAFIAALAASLGDGWQCDALPGSRIFREPMSPDEIVNAMLGRNRAFYCVCDEDPRPPLEQALREFYVEDALRAEQQALRDAAVTNLLAERARCDDMEDKQAVPAAKQAVQDDYARLGIPKQADIYGIVWKNKKAFAKAMKTVRYARRMEVEDIREWALSCKYNLPGHLPVPTSGTIRVYTITPEVAALLRSDENRTLVASVLEDDPGWIAEFYEAVDTAEGFYIKTASL